MSAIAGFVGDESLFSALCELIFDKSYPVGLHRVVFKEKLKEYCCLIGKNIVDLHLSDYSGNIVVDNQISKHQTNKMTTMKRFRSLFILSMAVLLMAGCNPLKRMQRNADQVRYEVTPEVLEAHGGEVALDIRGVYPENYFDRNVVAELTPVLIYDGGEIEFEKITVQGENVQDNHRVISRSGGSFNYDSRIDYTDALKRSELFLRVSATRRNNTEEFEPVKLADGVIATSTLIGDDAKPVIMADNFQRIVPETGMADILYLINSPLVRQSELRAEDVVKLEEFIQKVEETENLRFTGATVSSFASPDGPFNFNERLSSNRGVSADRVIRNQFGDIEAAQRDGFFSNITTAEDWEGFRRLVSESNIRDRDLILRVLSMYTDPAVREREIRNMSAAFEELKTDILPKLRRSQLIVEAERVGRSDQEILREMRSNPRVLSLEEMLYAATLVTDVNEQLNFYQTTAQAYPDCPRAHNNVGRTFIKLGRAGDAARAFQSAMNLSASDPIRSNLGFTAIMQGDFDQAEEYFTAMSSATPESRFGLGMVAVSRGEYDQAVNLFGTENSYNLGHALVLKSDYSRARRVLDAVTPTDCGKVNYMRAVVGARMADRDYMLTNLREAVNRDSDWKDYAATDLEFADYFVENAFISIVQ